MKQAWDMLQALDPRTCTAQFKDGSWGFETKPDVIQIGDWNV
jgi:hypothetical protein